MFIATRNIATFYSHAEGCENIAVHVATANLRSLGHTIFYRRQRALCNYGTCTHIRQNAHIYVKDTCVTYTR